MQHIDVMMYGDTLIEAWRGTILGEPSLRVQGCSEIFHSHFGHKYSTAVYGIAGKCRADSDSLQRDSGLPEITLVQEDSWWLSVPGSSVRVNFASTVPDMQWH